MPEDMIGNHSVGSSSQQLLVMLEAQKTAYQTGRQLQEAAVEAILTTQRVFWGMFFGIGR